MRLAADADPDTAQAILSSAGLTSYDIDKPESCFLYDELGNRYDVCVSMLKHACASEMILSMQMGWLLLERQRFADSITADVVDCAAV